VELPAHLLPEGLVAFSEGDKLKGKFVMLDPPREVKAHFDPEATRDADSSLLDLANADDPSNRQGRRRRFEMTPEMKQRALVNYHKMQLVEKEGAAGILSVSRGDGGNIFVQQASAAYHPDTPWNKRVGVYDPKSPKILPQVAVGVEHYNRLVRMIQKGERPKLEMNLEVSFGKIDSLYNVIGEIPGTDLADQVVMMGGHFDSWHGGTGATDDGTGTVAVMEAMRILKTLGLKPRRTIRAALWDGEEEGLHGSAAYVKAHFGTRETGPDGPGEVKLLPEADKFSVYFNHDNGSGKFRGVYMQGNEAVRSIFRAWLAPFDSLGASTLTLANTGGTDHLSFDAVGLPGFQFIQDELEYSTRTHHSIMDVYERVQEPDMKQAAVIMAAFAYQAAMRDDKFPRKELPKPRGAMPGSN
jgi:carboxypeptidase Q